MASYSSAEQPVEAVPITASYKWTRDEFVTAHLNYSRQRMRPRLQLVLYGFVAFVWYLVFASQGAGNPLLLGEAILVSCVVLGRELLWKQVARIKWKSALHRESDALFEFTPASIVTKTKFGDANLKWAAFVKIVETQDGFLFFQQPLMYRWVPFHAFESAADIQRARDMIVQSEVPFKALPAP